MDVILVLLNIRSAYNVGAMLRTAEGMGVSEVVLAGWTPRVLDANEVAPTENERFLGGAKKLLPHIAEKMAREIAKTALGAEKLVKIRNLADTEAVKNYLKSQTQAGWKTLVLDNNVPGKTSLKLSSPELRKQLGEKVILVVGEEVKGVPREIIEECELLAEIPMFGKKESFNVAVATGMALYELKGRI